MTRMKKNQGIEILGKVRMRCKGVALEGIKTIMIMKK